MSTVQGDLWQTPHFQDVTLNETEGACEMVIDDGGYEASVVFDSPATLRAWLTAMNQAAEWYLLGREDDSALTARQSAERHEWVWSDMTDDEREEAAEHAAKGGCPGCVVDRAATTKEQS